MTHLEHAVARDFKKASGAKNVSAVIDDEVIYITADNQEWTMEVGSDDDEMTFTCDDDQRDRFPGLSPRVVRFPIPEEFMS